METVFVVEDDENIRELVAYALGTAGFHVIGFENSRDFFAQIMSNNIPDIILLDIMLPDEDGISILKKLRNMKNTEKTPTIMLTAKSSEYDKIIGLDLGADDYITKPFSVLELISRIKAVLRRVPNTDNLELQKPDVISFGDITLDLNRRLVKVLDKNIVLTYKEFELLNFLLRNKGIVLSRDKIMEKVWGFDFEGESRTVDMHIKTLRKKLEPKGNIIETVRGVGYKIGE